MEVLDRIILILTVVHLSVDIIFTILSIYLVLNQKKEPLADTINILG